MKSDQAEQSRECYRQGFDRISWSNTPRPAYQGGIQRLMTAPLGEIIDLKPNETHGLLGRRISDGHGGEILLFQPKFVPSNAVL